MHLYSSECSSFPGSPCVICSTVNGVRSAHSTIHVRATRVGERITKKGVTGRVFIL